jgi:hypothetical protein
VKPGRAVLGCLAVALAACVPPPLAVRPVSCAVDVRLDPASRTLEARAQLELEELEARPGPGRRGRVELKLNPDLLLDAVRAEGATLVSRTSRRGRAGRGDDPVVPTTLRLLLEPTGRPIRLTLDYQGRLSQDVAAGEREGRVHNFAVSAHIGTEGVYLDDDGYWYPVLARAADADPAGGLVDYRLTADPIEGFELVAGLQRAQPSADPRLHWSSPFPLDGMVLLGGPLARASRPHGAVLLHAVLSPGKEAVARDILDASAENLERYVPLVGPYPFREFTVLEAFFSSGFAFPGCTQIAGSQLSEHQQYRRHGYLDHELLHNWWGNGVLVDPRDGNWCEGLASYLGNYYGYVLDGDEAGARKERRNQSNFLSGIEPGEDLPLGTFGRDAGAGRGVGYMKGAAVFHMLERKIGGAAFFAGLRRLTGERMGRHTSWDDIRAAMEAESQADLSPFFEQWVRRGGAPLLRLLDAVWEPGSTELRLTISQGPTDFQLDVPLRLFYGERSVEWVVEVDAPVDEVRVPCESAGLTAVELDPDYHVFRKLRPEEVMPTSALTRGGPKLLIVVPRGALPEAYRPVVDSFSRAVLGDEGQKKQGRSVRVLGAERVGARDLSASGVLILGDAVREAAVRQFLARTRSPVVWTATGFRIEGEAYEDPAHAVLLTVHHPDRPGAGVTVYRGNSPGALANARVLSFYPNSLLVFESPTGEAAAQAAAGGMPPTRVVRRMDFEFHERIEP